MDQNDLQHLIDIIVQEMMAVSARPQAKCQCHAVLHAARKLLRKGGARDNPHHRDQCSKYANEQHYFYLFKKQLLSAAQVNRSHHVA